jgi:replicative DNA helicase
MQMPQKVSDKNTRLTQNDFAKGQHQIIFTCIYNLGIQGINEIDVTEIENYLSVSDPVSYKRIFEGDRGSEWITKVLDDANTVNFEYYLNRVRKFSLLRRYIEEGIEVDDILDLSEIDPKAIEAQQAYFNELTVENIVNLVDKRILSAKHGFIIKDDSERRKAGDGGRELYDRLYDTPSYGLSLESGYINTITRGALPKKFYLETRDTGAGKTRIAIARLLRMTCPRMWSHRKGRYIDNVQAIGRAALYIGTEMDLYEELEPMMWAIVSGVEEDKIKDHTTTEEEDERISVAIEILEGTKLFLEDEPNYNISYLRQVTEKYKIEHDICALALDYIELNSALVGEFTSNTKGMGVREDQVLLGLSKGLKDISKDFDLFVMAFTQTTDEARRDHIRDQRAVKGARSLPNKVDSGVVVFEPTLKELDKLEKIIKGVGLNDSKIPNICHCFYKNRGTKYKKIRVWGWQNLGNMEYYDLFCTDDDYKRINIDPTFIKAKVSK